MIFVGNLSAHDFIVGAIVSGACVALGDRQAD